MPRAEQSLAEKVVQFYLTAPLSEIEGLQGTLRTIYTHRTRNGSGPVQVPAPAVAPEGKAREKAAEGKPSRSEIAKKMWAKRKKEAAKVKKELTAKEASEQAAQGGEEVEFGGKDSVSE